MILTTSLNGIKILKVIEKKSDTIFILRIKVRPNSRIQEIKIDKESNFLKIGLKSKAIQNKANIELIKLLRQYLKINTEQIKFISGKMHINKTIQINFAENIQEEEILERLLGNI